MLSVAFFLLLQSPVGLPHVDPTESAAAAPRPEIELPPGARVLFTIDGQGREGGAGKIDHLGKGIASLNDMNGDGTPDLLVGSVSGVPGLVQKRGFAEVRSGRDGSVLLRVDGRDRSTEVVFGGDGFGLRLGALPDVDGDGVGEFFVGGEPGLEAPYLNVYSGRNAALLRTFTAGDKAYPGLGDPFALRVLDDQDGDGLRDFALLSEGSTCLIARKDWKHLRKLAGECIGHSSDADGDRAPDYFALLNRFSERGEPVAGVLSSKRGTVLEEVKGPKGLLQMWNWNSSGDANGDGHLDLVCLFFGHENGGKSSPAKEPRFLARLLSGKDASVLREWTEELEIPGDLNDAAFVGDVDGDGCDELAIGHADGGGSVTLLSGQDGKRLARFASPGWSFGARIVRLGDLDGDGRGELAIGEPEHGRCAGRVWVISLGKS